MMLGHDLDKSPGRYCQGTIYVYDEETDQVVYEGPDSDLVPKLMRELVIELNAPDDCPMFVRAAMAHLKLVMIHPFRDGNGRMARALQTLILAREGILAPEFSSIEEWLGRNTNAYYAVLADVGAGSWNPQRPTDHWVRFNLRAHHMQAQTVLRRINEASKTWGLLDALAERTGLPDRSLIALCPAAIGLRVRRSAYEKDAEVEPATAGRDLRILVSAGLIEARGETRGRFYVGTEVLREIRREAISERRDIRDPYDEASPPHEPRQRAITIG